MLKLTCLVLWLIVQLSSASDVSQIVVCEDEGAQFGCPENKIIRIDSAIYGRESNEVCSTGRYYNLRYCSLQNVTRSIIERCDGRKNCHFKVDNSISMNDPCYKVSKYLKINWYCDSEYEVQTRHPNCRTNTYLTYICENERRNLYCNWNEKLIISEALFGRDNFADGNGDDAKCEFGRFREYCQPNDVSRIVQNEMCDGNYCEIKPDLQLLGDPCPGIFKYFRLRYYCCPRYDY